MEATSLDNSPTQQRISNLHTTCKKCCFAEYTENTQVGCSLGVIEKLRTTNPNDIVEVYDNDKEFFIINNRTCMYCRDHNWAAFHKNDDLENKVRSQVQLKINYIIYYDATSTSEQLLDTLRSVNHQKLPTKSVIVLNNSGQELSGDIQSFLATHQIPWVIEKFFEIRTMDAAIDYFISKQPKKQNWFSIAKAGYIYDHMYGYILNEKIVNNLEKILCVLPDQNGNGGFFNKFTFAGAVGNKGFNFFEKMLSLEDQSYCVTLEELCRP